MFHSVPGVPLVKMERFAGMNTKFALWQLKAADMAHHELRCR